MPGAPKRYVGGGGEECCEGVGEGWGGRGLHHSTQVDCAESVQILRIASSSFSQGDDEKKSYLFISWVSR